MGSDSDMEFCVFPVCFGKGPISTVVDFPSSVSPFRRPVNFRQFLVDSEWWNISRLVSSHAFSRVFDGTFYKLAKKKVAVIPDGTPRAGPPLWPLEIHKGSTSRVKIHAEVPEHCLDPPRLRNCNETRVSNSCLDPTMFISNRFKKLSHIDCYMVYFKLPSHLVFD